MHYPDYIEFKTLLEDHCKRSLSHSESEILGDYLSKTESRVTFSELLQSETVYQENDSINFESVSFDNTYKKILSRISDNENQKSLYKHFVRHNNINKIIIWSLTTAAIIFSAFYVLNLLVPSNPANLNSIAGTNSCYEVRTPFGAKTNIVLSDGTSVTLNSGSVISYDNNYNVNDRNISLEGEAYFKVAKRDTIPFIVSAENVSIRAKGTEFNVKAYENEEIIEATLIEGSITVSSRDDNSGDVKSVELFPQQKALYIKSANLLEINTETRAGIIDPDSTGLIQVSSMVDVEQVIAWTRDKLILKNEPIEELSVKLQRKYDVEITFADEETKKIRFSGILDDEPIEQVMLAIKLSAPIDYTIRGKKIMLFTDRNRSK